MDFTREDAQKAIDLLLAIEAGMCAEGISADKNLDDCMALCRTIGLIERKFKEGK